MFLPARWQKSPLYPSLHPHSIFSCPCFPCVIQRPPLTQGSKRQKGWPRTRHVFKHQWAWQHLISNVVLEVVSEFDILYRMWYWQVVSEFDNILYRMWYWQVVSEFDNILYRMWYWQVVSGFDNILYRMWYWQVVSELDNILYRMWYWQVASELDNILYRMWYWQVVSELDNNIFGDKLL